MSVTPYCGPEDLILGKMHKDDGAGKIRFTELAAEEINECLANVYVLPLAPIPPILALSEATRLALKRCNIFIASGRYLMDAAAGGQVEGVDAYGLYLLGEGKRLLDSMESGQLDLGAIKIVTATTGDAPMITNLDSVSGLDAYYGFSSGDPLVYGETYGWRPGVSS